MSKRQLVLSLVCAVSVGVGCHEAPIADGPQGSFATKQLPIMDGYASYDDTAVVGLGMGGNGGFGTCSGSLITPNVVLTAQHCIASLSTGQYVDCNSSTFGAPTNPGYVFVTQRSPMPWDGDAYVGVREIAVPPNATGGACGFDIALLILSNSVPWADVTPIIPRVDQALSYGEVYSAIGYGATNDNGNGSGTRRRRDNLTVQCGTGQCPNWAARSQEWVGEAGVCQGDSGGPAVDDKGRVVGIASRGGQGCSSPIYTGVSTWGDWIKQQVIYASDLEGIEAPEWAYGHTTDPAFNHPVGKPCSGVNECADGLCISGICTRRCNEEAACPDEYECDPGSGMCVPDNLGQPCVTTDQCLGGTCLDGGCTRPCSTDAPCPTGFECDALAAQCRPFIGVSCDDNETCSSGRCIDGVCTRGCSTDDACPKAWSCNAGVCELDPVGMGCLDHAACPGGICVDNICTRLCDPQSPCPMGYRCDATSGRCLLIPVGGSCNSNAQCSFSTCISGICTRPCSDEAPCSLGHFCDASSGMCITAPVGDYCDSPETCTTGLCVGGVCSTRCNVDFPCPDGYDCNDSGRCELIPVGDSCSVSGDCVGGLCLPDGTCSRQCADNAPCPGGYTCSVGFCIEIPIGQGCVVAADCPGGFCDADGMCTYGCSEQLTCPGGFACDPEIGACQRAAAGCASETPRPSIALALFALLVLAYRRRWVATLRA